MSAGSTDTFAGARGTIATVDWPHDAPRRVVVLAHGYGEHIGRYEHVAQELDALAPLEATRAAVERLRGEALEEHVHPGAMHEVLNETNRDEVLADVQAFLERVS